MGTLLLALVLAPVAFGSPQGTSACPIRLDDPSAVYVSAHGGSTADDTAAIQAAVDQVQEAQGSGIVFLVSGRYRISNTIQVWPGIRLIGYGPTRPEPDLPPPGSLPYRQPSPRGPRHKPRKDRQGRIGQAEVPWGRPNATGASTSQEEGSHF